MMMKNVLICTQQFNAGVTVHDDMTAYQLDNVMRVACNSDAERELLCKMSLVSICIMVQFASYS
jgi:hypothetical protein